MPTICLYLQLHQPYRLTDLNVLDIGAQKTDYFSRFDPDKKSKNRQVFQKVATKSYVPMLSLLSELLQKHDDFRLALSMSGVFVEQAQRYQPRVIKLLKNIVATGRVELLAETYHHSLSSLYSTQEFKKQVALHTDLMEELFGVTPKIFRNTELIYSNEIAELVAEQGFAGMLTEAVDRYLHGRLPTQVFVSRATQDSKTVPLLLKNYQLSDDIAFRFSEKSWQWHPLSSQQYLEWIEAYTQEDIVNLFMDFETFGEHQWADTGIFEFFTQFVQKFLLSPYNRFATPTQLFGEFKQRELSSKEKSELIYNVPQPISWADIDRDLTAWRDNDLQFDSLRALYKLEDILLRIGDKKLIDSWRKLQTSDHFYYMCTKWFADGDVHAYFSPYESPYEAYRYFSIALADLQGKVMPHS